MLLSAITVLLSNAFTAQAQTDPTNDQLLDNLIASAAPGATHVASGDMLLSVADLEEYRDNTRGDRQVSSAFANGSFKTNYWPNGVVPYSFDSSFSSAERDVFLLGCRQWSNVAQLSFVPRTNENDYIRVVLSSRNQSVVGRKGGRQDLLLAPNQGQYIAAHEIAHALGVLHEQNRSDRDNYVTIKYENIVSEAAKDDFGIKGNSNNRTSYDFYSIMHYGQFDYSKNLDVLPTIVAKPGYEQFQNDMGGSVLSVSDKNGMASIYGTPAPVRYQLSGTVRTNPSQPLSGVSISLQSNTSSMPAPVNTDAQGNYSFSNLLAGTYIVRASKAGYRFDLNPRQIQLSGVSTNNNFNASVIQASELPKLSVGVQRVREGDAYTPAANARDTSYVSINVTLSEPSQDTVAVDYATQDDTALAGSDYVSGRGRVYFAPGRTSLAISVRILPDAVVEGNETFRLNISNPAGATILDGSGAGVLLNDDVAGFPIASPQLYVSDPVVTEGDSGSPFITVNVSMSAPSQQTVTVNYATVNSGALAGSDFNNISGILTFTPGMTTVAVNVPILPDKVAENNEQFKFRITNANGATISDLEGAPTITNDDGIPPTGASTTTEFTDSLDSTNPSAPSAHNLETRKLRRLALLDLKQGKSTQ